MGIPLVALSVRPTATPQDLQAQQMQLKNLSGQNAMIPGALQEQQNQVQLGQQAVQQGQFAVQDRQAGMKAMQQWDGKDPNQLPDLVRQNGGSLNAVVSTKAAITKAQQDVQNLNKAQLDNQATKTNYLLGKLQAATDPKVPDVQLAGSIQQATQDAINDGYLDPQHAQQIQQYIQQFPNPADLRAHIGLYEKSLMAQNTQFSQEQATREANVKAQEANAQDWKTFPTLGVALNTRTGESQTPAGQVLTPEMMQSKYVGIQQKQRLGQQLTPEEQAFSGAYEKNKTLVPQFNFNMQTNALQGNARDMAAENYFQTTQLPSGMRSPAISAAIITRAAQLHPNGTTELAGNRAAYDANKKSYDNVTGTLDTLSAFESSANKNMDQFLNLTKNLPNTGMPWLNTPIRDLDQNLVGAEWMPAINAARSIMDREIARVTNDPKLSGSLTDSARAEVSGINPANATLGQIVHVTQTLRNDMSNVHSSLAQQKQDIGSRLGIAANSPQAGGNAPPTGAPTATGPNGHKIVVDGGKWVDYQTGAPIQ